MLPAVIFLLYSGMDSKYIRYRNKKKSCITLFLHSKVVCFSWAFEPFPKGRCSSSIRGNFFEFCSSRVRCDVDKRKAVQLRYMIVNFLKMRSNGGLLSCTVE